MIFLKRLKRAAAPWYFTAKSTPRALAVIRRARRQVPEAFRRNEHGDCGFSFYRGWRRVTVLARSMQIFRWTHGYWPDLLAPRALTEKIFARKFLTRIPPPCPEDKTLTRRYAAAAGIAAPARIAEATEPERLLEQAPPEGSCFVKLNRASLTNTKVTFPLDAQARAALLRQMHGWRDIRGRLAIGEWWNALIEPVYFIEAAETHANGAQLEDWKFFVVHGRVILVQVDYDRFSGHRRNFLDRSGKELAIRMIKERSSAPVVLPPAFARMVAVAEAIGRRFDLVRVDLYAKDGQEILLGELTLVPISGVEPIDPPEENVRLGELYRFEPGQPCIGCGSEEMPAGMPAH
jgi:TupA-like ATPgrasp